VVAKKEKKEEKSVSFAVWKRRRGEGGGENVELTLKASAFSMNSALASGPRNFRMALILALK